MITSTWTLVEVVMGIANKYNQHVLRNHDIYFGDKQIEKLYGLSDYPSESEIQGVVREIGGLDVQPSAMAYIDDNAWNLDHRGLCKIRLYAETNNGLTQTNCVVIGYVAGGSLFDGKIPMDARFVPVKCFMYDTRATTGINGLPVLRNNVTSFNQFETSNPNVQSTTIRPIDIISQEYVNLVTNQSFAGMSGAEDLDGVSFVHNLNSDISSTGTIISRYENANTTSFCSDIVRTAVSMTHMRENNTLPEIYSSATDFTGIKEESLLSNPFYLIMSKSFLYTTGSGFTFSNIAEAFPTFFEPGVINTIVSENYNNQADNTLTSNQFGQVKLTESLATELALIVKNVMVQTCRLASIRIEGTNCEVGYIDPSLEMIPQTGIYLIGSNALPLLSTADENLPFIERQLLERIANDFYYKYTNRPYGSKLLFNIIIEANIYKEILIKIWDEGGNPDTADVYNFAIWADSKFSPIYTEGEYNAKNKLTNINENIKSILIQNR